MTRSASTPVIRILLRRRLEVELVRRGGCGRRAAEDYQVDPVLRERDDRLDDVFKSVGRARESLEVRRLVPALLEMGNSAAGNPHGQGARVGEATQPAAEGAGPFLHADLHFRPEY